MSRAADTGESAEWLARLGIELFDPDVDAAAHAECVRIARRLDKTGCQTIGLWPAADDVAIPPLAIQLGLALTQLTSGTAAVIDANVHRPGLALHHHQRQPSDDASIFETRWIRGSLALVVPKWIGESGAGVPQLEAMINANAHAFGHMLVDLTGFDQLGDHLNAIELLDGVVMVARAARTREFELLKQNRQLAARRNLGVVLVGGAAPTNLLEG